MKFILFADDTNLFFCNHSLSELENIINKELEYLSTWFKSNKLSLNVSKTNYILFQNKGKRVKAELNIVIDGISINQVNNTKFLGLHIDESLTWIDHLTHISSKISKNIGIIKRLSKIVPHHVLITLYNTLIAPYLNYCNIIWASNYPGRLTPLEALQKRVVIIICNTDRLASTSSLFKQLNLLKLQDINILQIAQFMYKYHHHLLPTVFNDYFVLNSNVHEHNTRSSAKNKCHLPSIKTNIRKFSIKFSGPTIWNNTSNHTTSVASLAIFKNKLINSIITNY
jgi:hypothetical protein